MYIVEIVDDATRYWLSAAIDETGALVVSGHDLSKNLEELLGTDEYEYWYTVAAADVPRVCAALLATPANLLQELKDLLSPFGISASTEWRDWLTRRGIPFQFANWR